MTMRTVRRFKAFNGVRVPRGDIINIRGDTWDVPDFPIIPYIEGDGIGPEIWVATRRFVDAAVTRAYRGRRKIVWFKIFAGDAAKAKFGDPLPADTLAALKYFRVGIKGPLGTPTGGGIRSLNVTMRQELDLNQCIRPVRYFQGVPSVVKHPEKLNVTIFRQNTEDVYAGVEFKAGTDTARALMEYLITLGVKLRQDSGIGIKPISKYESQRIVRAGIEYARKHGRKTVTLVHKGNIQKCTEGAFRDWGFELAQKEFGDSIIFAEDYWNVYGGKLPEGKILINDMIADASFQELLIRPERMDVIVTTNLNGDYLSDAAAAQVGGLGIAPGANIGDHFAIFEATHGTAPDIAGKGLANPTSLLLSALMMLERMGWKEAADLIQSALEKTIADHKVTGDLARFIVIPGIEQISAMLGDVVTALSQLDLPGGKKKLDPVIAKVLDAVSAVSTLAPRRKDVKALSTSQFTRALISNLPRI